MLLIYSCSEDVEVSQSSTADAPAKSSSLERAPFESNYKPLKSERRDCALSIDSIGAFKLPNA